MRAASEQELPAAMRFHLSAEHPRLAGVPAAAELRPLRRPARRRVQGRRDTDLEDALVLAECNPVCGRFTRLAA